MSHIPTSERLGKYTEQPWYRENLECADSKELEAVEMNQMAPKTISTRFKEPLIKK